MQERQVNRLSGWLVLPVTIAVWLLVPVIAAYAKKHGQPGFLLVLTLICNVLLGIFLSKGFFTLQPNA